MPGEEWKKTEEDGVEWGGGEVCGAGPPVGHEGQGLWGKRASIG